MPVPESPYQLAFRFSLCLKAFSWLSVIEILRAADIMLKPILSGTVKAQAKGIIPFIHSAVQQQYGRLHAGGLPQGKYP